MAESTSSNNPIPSGIEDYNYDRNWSLDPEENLPYCGKSVENFLKGELKSKIGYQAFSTNPDESGYFHILGFANETCYDKWLEDPSLYGNLLLDDKRLPIKETSATSYIVNLSTRSNQQIIVSTTGHIVLSMRCTSQEYNPISGQTIDTGETVTLTLQRRATNSDTWTTVATLEGISTSPASLQQYFDLDITSYLSTGNQQFRIKAVGEETGTQSAYVTFASIINTVIALEFATDWSQPQQGDIQLSYYIQGAINKLLYVKIDNELVVDGAMVSIPWVETPYPLPAITPEQFPNICRQGVHTIEAWLEVADDTSIKTDVLRNEIFYLADTTDDTTYIVLQDINQNIQPYVNTNLFKYCIFSNVSSAVDLIVNIKSEDGLTNYLMQNLGAVETQVIKDYYNILEIESEESTINAFLYLSTIKNGEQLPIHQTIELTIDNSESFAPTAMNSNGFILNPNSRSNEEPNPKTIINFNTGETLLDSEFLGFNMVNDLWQQDSEGNHSLRIPAGRKVRFNWDVYEQLRSANSTSSLTIEIDYKISGLRDYNAEKDPILTIGKYLNSDNQILGLEMLPLRAHFLTQNKRSINTQDVQWEEDNRTHLTVNIIYNAGNRGKNYVRIMLDSGIQREFDYSNDIFGGEDYDDKYITIGNNSSDIDIYGIRIYKQPLSSQQVQQDYRAAIPTSEEKVAYKEANDILGDDNTISIAKCQNHGYNTLRWIADDDSKNIIANYSNQGNNLTKGTVEMLVYRKDGSGVLDYRYCQKITHCKQKGQGTSSMTYWMWNLDFRATSDSQRYYMNEQFQWVLDEEVSGEDCYFIFPNGLSTRSDIKGVKNVAKANWASSMQSHKMGWCNLYTDLYWRVIGNSASNTLPKYANTRKSVTQLPFFFFAETNSGSCVFSNLMTFGPGKYDKLCFGTKAPSPHYIKNGEQKAWFTALEGSANGRHLPMRRIPWLRDEVFYYLNRDNDKDSKNECLIYNNEDQLDVDKAIMDVYNEGEDNEFEIPKGFTLVDGSSLLWQETVDTEYDSEDIYKCEGGNTIKFFRRAYNFDYLHNFNLENINGTVTLLREREQAGLLDVTKQYWVSQSGGGYSAYDLFRYNPLTGTFVNAGAERDLNETDTYARLNLMTQCHDWLIEYGIEYNESRPDLMNEAFIQARLKDYKAHSTLYYNEQDCRYDLMFRKFAALKDNWCKNTYERLEIDGLISMDSDDNDTSGDLDNVGASKCPYFVEEHDHCDADGNFEPYIYNFIFNVSGVSNITKGAVYTCNGNTFTILDFNLNSGNGTIECGCSDNESMPVSGVLNKESGTGDSQINFSYYTKSVFNTYWNSDGNVRFCLMEKSQAEECSTMMQSMLNAMSDIGGTVMGCMEMYMFSTQRYFPATVYNEQSRLLYETAAVARTNGEYSNAIDPLSQNLGNHLLSELEFWKKRIVYLESWSRANEFANRTGTGTFSFRSGKDNAVYQFTITCYQALYPAVMVDGSISNVVKKYRMLPGTTHTLEPVTVGTQDITCFLCGIDYLTSMGDLSGMSINSDVLNIVSRRLVNFQADGLDGEFSPGNLSFSAPRMQQINVTNVQSIRSAIDLSIEKDIEFVNFEGTNTSSVTFPESDSLSEIRLGRNITRLRLKNLPALETFDIQDAQYLSELYLEKITNQSSYDLCVKLFGLGASQSLSNVNIVDINWTSETEVSAYAVIINMLAQAANSTVTGKIHIVDNVNYNVKANMLQSWGAVDNVNNDVYVTYNIEYVESLRFYAGKSYISERGNYEYVVISEPLLGNNFTNIEWQLSANAADYAILSNKGILRVINLPSVDSEMYINKEKITVTQTITLMDNTQMSVSMEVGLWEHQAELGDYVYADGSVSDIVELNKIVVGICWYIDAEDPTKRLMITPSNIGSQMWGLYNSASYFPNIQLSPTNPLGVDGAYLIGTTSAAAGYITLTRDYLFAGYHEGDVVPVGLYNSLEIAYHCRCVLDDPNINLMKVETYAQNNHVDTRTALLACIELAKTALRNAGFANYNQAAMFYWPATYYCLTYEPTIPDGYELNDKFKRGKWFLYGYGDWNNHLLPYVIAYTRAFTFNVSGVSTAPAVGAMYTCNGNTFTVTRVTLSSGSGTIDCSYIGDGVIPNAGTLVKTSGTGANNIVFSSYTKAANNIFQRAINDGIFTKFTSSYYWLSRENSATTAYFAHISGLNLNLNHKYNSHYLRGVAAF